MLGNPQRTSNKEVNFYQYFLDFLRSLHIGIRYRKLYYPYCYLALCRVLHGVSKKFGEWYQKTNKTEDTNKLTLLTLKIIAIFHNTLLAAFIKLL
jgi:hypothetical protein